MNVMNVMETVLMKEHVIVMVIASFTCEDGSLVCEEVPEAELQMDVNYQ